MTIRYLGIITQGRIPRHLLAALVELQRRGEIPVGSARFEFYGNCSPLEPVLRQEFPSLSNLFSFHPHVPYRESLEMAVTADHLLFCENSIIPKKAESLSAQGILTTKLFEYLASGRPVLADLSPETLAGQMIRNAGDHHFVSNSTSEFQEFLISRRFWQPVPSIDHPFVKTLSRSSQAEQYIQKLDVPCRH